MRNQRSKRSLQRNQTANRRRGVVGRVYGRVGSVLVVASAIVVTALATETDSLSVTVGVGPSYGSDESAILGGAIVFAHQDNAAMESGIFVSEPNNAPARLLVGHDGRTHRKVAWPKPDTVLYTAGAMSDSRALYRINPDGTGQQQISADVAGSVDSFLVDRSGDRVAFSRQHPDESSHLYIVNLDGTGERAIESANRLGPGEDWCHALPSPTVTPQSWSADGQRLIVGVSARGCEDEFAYVAVVDIAADTTGPLPQDDGTTYAADWSPDGGALFLSTPHGVVVSGGLSAQRKDMASMLAEPAWGPDGALGFARFAPHADGAERFSLSVVRQWEATAADVAVASVDSRIRSLTWSASGDHIAFIVYTEGNRELWVAGASDQASFRVSGPPTGWVVDHAYAPQGGSR